MRRGPRWFAGSADAIYQNLNLDLRRAAEVHLRLRCRPHLPDGSAPDDRAAHRARRRDHGRRHPRADRERRRVRRDRDRRELAHDPCLPREAEGPGRDGRVARRGARVDGELRLLGRRPDRRRHPRRRRRDLGPRPRRQHHPRARRAGRGLRLGLREQQDRRCERARPRLLARRRDARRLLRRAHGPDLGRPDVQPLQRGLADPHLAGAAAAREVRLRGRGPDRLGDELHGLRRCRRLGRHRAPVDPLAQRARPLARARRGLGADARRRRRPRRDRPERDRRQERADRAGRADRRRPRGRPGAVRDVGRTGSPSSRRAPPSRHERAGLEGRAPHARVPAGGLRRCRRPRRVPGA